MTTLLGTPLSLIWEEISQDDKHILAELIPDGLAMLPFSTLYSLDRKIVPSLVIIQNLDVLLATWMHVRNLMAEKLKEIDNEEMARTEV